MRVTLLSSFTAIAQSDWDNLVGRCYPFMRYGFFLALEQGGSIGQQRGWLPQYAVSGAAIGGCQRYQYWRGADAYRSGVRAVT